MASRHNLRPAIYIGDELRVMGRPVTQEFLKWLSRLCRGTVEEKLRWMFRLYDINNDGRITRGEMSSVFISIYALLGGVSLTMLQEDSVVSSRVEQVFQVSSEQPPHRNGIHRVFTAEWGDCVAE